MQWAGGGDSPGFFLGWAGEPVDAPEEGSEGDGEAGAQVGPETQGDALFAGGFGDDEVGDGAEQGQVTGQGGGHGQGEPGGMRPGELVDQGFEEEDGGDVGDQIAEQQAAPGQGGELQVVGVGQEGLAEAGGFDGAGDDEEGGEEEEHRPIDFLENFVCFPASGDEQGDGGADGGQGDGHAGEQGGEQ